MTETQVFKRAVGALVAMGFVPLLFVLITSGGSDTIKQKVGRYLNSSNNSMNQSKGDVTMEENHTEDNNKVSDPAENPQPSTEADSPGDTTTNTPSQASTYEVKPGDTYGCIAEKYYGSYDQWQKVFDANAGYSGFAEYELHVGAKLTMPAISDAETTPKTNLCV